SALLSLGASTLSMATVFVMTRWRAPDVFATMAGGSMATALAFGLYWLDIFRDSALMIAASLILLVPGLLLVSAVQGAIDVFSSTSVVWIVCSVLADVGLVAGVLFGIVVLARLGAPEFAIA